MKSLRGPMVQFVVGLWQQWVCWSWVLAGVRATDGSQLISFQMDLSRGRGTSCDDERCISSIFPVSMSVRYLSSKVFELYSLQSWLYLHME